MTLFGLKRLVRSTMQSLSDYPGKSAPSPTRHTRAGIGHLRQALAAERGRAEMTP